MTTFTKGTKGKTKGGLAYEVLSEETETEPTIAHVFGKAPTGKIVNAEFGYCNDGTLNLPEFLVGGFEEALGYSLDALTLEAPAKASGELQRSGRVEYVGGSDKYSNPEISGNTPVTVTLPLGLARVVTAALAEYAEATNKDRKSGRAPEHDSRILQLIAGANDLVREAATNVDPLFNSDVAYVWGLMAPNANKFLRGLHESGQLKPGAIAATLAAVDIEYQANAA
jgi:hypothetical protein